MVALVGHTDAGRWWPSREFWRDAGVKCSIRPRARSTREPARQLGRWRRAEADPASANGLRLSLEERARAFVSQGSTASARSISRPTRLWRRCRRGSTMNSRRDGANLSPRRRLCSQRDVLSIAYDEGVPFGVRRPTGIQLDGDSHHEHVTENFSITSGEKRHHRQALANTGRRDRKRKIKWIGRPARDNSSQKCQDLPDNSHYSERLAGNWNCTCRSHGVYKRYGRGIKTVPWFPSGRRSDSLGDQTAPE